MKIHLKMIKEDITIVFQTAEEDLPFRNKYFILPYAMSRAGLPGTRRT